MHRRDFMKHGAAGLALTQGASGQQENSRKGISTIKIKLSSVYGDDQDKALKFYTEVLGLLRKRTYR